VREDFLQTKEFIFITIAGMYIGHPEVKVRYKYEKFVRLLR
jgi:hypothetical protein